MMIKMSILQTCLRTRIALCVLSVLILAVLQVTSLNGPNVCMVQQKYNVTKRVRYRAPMSVRTYEWCFSMPPRCSHWKTEMRDLTRLETEERTAEVAVCCPGYKMKDVSCVPICPNGKTGSKCTEECPPNKWGPNCRNECIKCLKGTCSPITGDCECLEGWQGESCNIRMTTPPPPALMEEILTTTKSTLQTLSPLTKTATSAKTINLESTVPVTYNSNAIFTTYRKPEEPITTMKTTPLLPTEDAYNISVPSTMTSIQTSSIILTTPKLPTTFVYNRTETATEGTSTNLTTSHVTSTSKPPLITKSIRNVYIATPISSTVYSMSSPSLNSLNQISTTTETIKKIETTTKSLNVSKLKPKEIWIKPTQKGMSTEFKIKASHELTHSRTASKNDSSSEITTPRTIIVSIIPTSVSHASFKKIALTTASYLQTKMNVSKVINQRVETRFTKSMTMATPTQAPFTIKILTTKQKNLVTTSPFIKNVTKPILPRHSPKKALPKNFTSTAKPSSTEKMIFNTFTPKIKSTNSMTSSWSPTRKFFYSTNAIASQTSTNKVFEITTKATSNLKDDRKFLKDEIYRSQESNLPTSTKKSIATNITEKVKTTILVKIPTKKISERNVTKTVPITITTESPPEDETFHILTEPEHITAVMTDKEKEKNSLDLISVVSVVGGIMMAVITVAVIIVMFERCRRPRYDDIRKMHDIQMRAMMANEDPPPYVRSIFHTPLPEPPAIEKCHYQPISTLDRNLKQFMRPVVVQNISPIMLENFRGILECHYDHLPQRSQIEISGRSSFAPSLSQDEQHSHRTIAEYTIDALKCEAKLDIIDSTNAEPLYAEIPCWRPPSEHAVEVINLNGEAVTEL